MVEIFEIAFFVFLASVKILFAPASMLAAGHSLIETMIITYVGGLLGSIVFYYFGVAIFNWWDGITGKNKKKKFIFSRKARTMVSVKMRYGIIGLAALAPIISVPVSALIVAKFFPANNRVVAVYALVLAPISVGLTLLSDPVIQPILGLIKRVLGT